MPGRTQVLQQHHVLGRRPRHLSPPASAPNADASTSSLAPTGTAENHAQTDARAATTSAHSATVETSTAVGRAQWRAGPSGCAKRGVVAWPPTKVGGYMNANCRSNILTAKEAFALLGMRISADGFPLQLLSDVNTTGQCGLIRKFRKCKSVLSSCDGPRI